MDIKSHEILLDIVRVGIGTSKDAKIPYDVDWAALKALADAQGLTAVVLDGLNEVRSKKENVSDERFPSQQFTLQWIGEVMQNYEIRYQQYEKSISSLGGFYNQYGFRMMVLKGYACSLDWPKPNHRPCGDIDIWQFGKQKEADEILRQTQGTGFKIDNSHEHHTVFYWRDFMVENHYDFIDVHHRKSSSELEKIFKELGADDSYFIKINDEKIYLPSINLHALFLLRHMMEHFASKEMTLRQLLDWAFFVNKHGKDVDWKWLEKVLVQYGMMPAYTIFNYICVKDLGFDVLLFPKGVVDATIHERVLNEIMQPEFDEIQPCGLLPRIIYKFRRWKANGWKNDLCFKESMWSSFWSGVWGHMLKPKTI